jgi:peptidyl-prolyl cis-trans isomerase D
MSVIQSIRDKAAWFIFGAIALSLLAFILQDAFMRNRGGGGMFSNTSTVGKVNGVSIDKTDFDSKVNFYEQMNGATHEQLIGSVWEYLVDQTIMQQLYDKLGLQYTSKEQNDAFFGANPPQWLQQNFTDPSTGIYNGDQAKQFFAQLKKNPNDQRVNQIYLAYIEPTIQQALRQKYQTLITGAVYIPKWLAEKTNADNNSIAKISYITVPYTSVSDSAIKVSDDEINAYVKKHSKRFEQKEETRQVSYVTFSASPSGADSQAVVKQLDQLQPEFAATNDEKSFLSKNGTEIPYYDSYISKNEIKQKVKDTLFTLAPGQIYGPYLDQNNYVLAKMVDKKDLPDSVKVRHILIATHQQDNSGQLIRVKDDSAAKKRLDSAVALINSGAKFDSVCAVYSDDPGSKDKGGVYDYFPSGRMVEEFNDFVFTGKTGAKKIIHTSYGYHYVEILGQKGSAPAYKIAYLAKPITASQETDDSARNAANQFAANNANAQKFNSGAAKINKQPRAATDIKENDFSIPAIGDNRQLVRWIYDNSVGDVSDPFEVGDKYVVVLITGDIKPGLMPAQAARQIVEPFVRNEKKAQQIISVKMKGKTLDEISKSANTSVQTADSVSFQAFVIPNLGNEPKIIGAAFNKQIQGKVSEPIAGNTGVFVISGQGISATSSLGANPTTTRQTLETQLKSQIGYTALNALHDAADIKDYRYKFY